MATGNGGQPGLNIGRAEAGAASTVSSQLRRGPQTQSVMKIFAVLLGTSFEVPGSPNRSVTLTL